MDVLRGQVTDDVISLLRDNNVHYVLVPNNMTQLFQALDLTVNKHCKSYLKQLFSEWYAQQIECQLSLGKKVQEIKICLTTLKPLHAKWLIEYYNEITSENGSSVIINGWKAAGIYDAIKAGSSRYNKSIHSKISHLLSPNTMNQNCSCRQPSIN